MKSASKIPFKSKKTPYNLNEVDVNLLLKNPSSIRKIVKGNKEVPYHDDDEDEEDDIDEDADQDDKLERHMKRYISEYFDNKYKKESEQRGRVKDRMKIIKMISPLHEDDYTKWYNEKSKKAKEEQKLNPKKTFIRKYIDKIVAE